MAQLQKEQVLKYSVKQLFNLVLDIENYPNFLPWCSSAKIIERSDSKIIADLTIKFKGFSETYRSSITSNISDPNFAKINVASLSGPFKHLVNNWTFEDMGDGMTKVKFFINFEFKSVLLDKLLGIFFSLACQKMIQAFEDRAKQLYD